MEGKYFIRKAVEGRQKGRMGPRRGVVGGGAQIHGAGGSREGESSCEFGGGEKSPPVQDRVVWWVMRGVLRCRNSVGWMVLALALNVCEGSYVAERHRQDRPCSLQTNENVELDPVNAATPTTHPPPVPPTSPPRESQGIDPPRAGGSALPTLTGAAGRWARDPS